MSVFGSGRGDEFEDSEEGYKVEVIGVVFDVPAPHGLVIHPEVQEQNGERGLGAGREVRDGRICAGNLVFRIIEMIRRTSKSIDLQFPEI